MTSSCPNYLPKARSANTIMLGVRTSTYKFLGGHKHLVLDEMVTCTICEDVCKIAARSIAKMLVFFLQLHFDPLFKCFKSLVLHIQRLNVLHLTSLAKEVCGPPAQQQMAKVYKTTKKTYSMH